MTSSNPTNGNQFVTTSTDGVAGGGKIITATFSIAMNPSTINQTTFTLKPVGGADLIPVSVTYNASTNVATLTTSSALLPDTSYTAIITQGATSATGTPLACSYAWNFKTATTAASSPAPVNLGLAAPFGIAATAGVTNTATAPNTTINGNVVLHPVAGATCNAVPVDATGGFGICGGFPPTINGQVISPLFPADAGATSGPIVADLQAAFLSITPPAG
ncbi:MAG: Ig-like domain-containing protein, partial [Gammaproteobacteria bacterium]